MSTINELASRNTNELHERLCQQSEVARRIIDADCTYKNGVHVLYSMPCSLPELYTVRFTALADYKAGEKFRIKNEDYEVRTPDMTSPATGTFKSGAVIVCQVDMARKQVFLTVDSPTDLSDYATIEYVDEELAKKADKTDLDAYATIEYVDDELAKKAEKVHTHVIPDVTGLQGELDAKAPLDSPAFIGTPTAPTPSFGDASTRVATTEYVKSAGFASEEEMAKMTPMTRRIDTNAPLYGGGDLTADRMLSVADASTSGKGVVQLSSAVNDSSEVTAATSKAVKDAYDLAASKAPAAHNHQMADVVNLQPTLDQKAPLLSPAFSGNPTAPTPALADSSTSVATTEFVHSKIQELEAGGGLTPKLPNLSFEEEYAGYHDEEGNKVYMKSINVTIDRNAYIFPHGIANLRNIERSDSRISKPGGDYQPYIEGISDFYITLTHIHFSPIVTPKILYEGVVRLYYTCTDR